MKKRLHLFINFNLLRVRLAFLFAALSFSFVTTACTVPQNDQTAIPFMDGVLRGKLENGLKYYIYENKKPQDRAFLTLAVNAGSLLETEEQRGLAHFLEHMAFNGTKRFPESDLVEYLRSLGMRFGADLNAFTSYDETVYELEVPTETANGIKTVPQKAIDILDDWTSSIILNDKDVADERLIVMEEYRMRQGASARMRRFLFPLLFEGSQYAVREPIGLPEVIQNAPVSQLKDFYTKWYTPSNMALIIVGDFDSAALEKQLKSSFDTAAKDSVNITASQITENSTDRPQYFLSDPVFGHRQYEVFLDTELTRTSVTLFYKHKWEPHKNDIAMFRQELTDMIITMILDERFDEAAQKPETPFLNAGAGWTRYVRNSLHWSLAATSKQGNSTQTLSSILQMKEAVLQQGFTDAEIERAKQSMLAYLETEYNEREKKESRDFVELFVSNFLKNQYASSAEWDLKNTKTILPSITKQILNERFKYYFSPDDLFVFIYAPSSEAETIPPANEIENILISSASSIVTQNEDITFNSELLDTVPVKGKIVKETYDKNLKLTHWTLSNGAKVIINQTKNKNDQIVLFATARGGYTSSSVQDNISARLVSEMLTVSGIGKWSLTELTKKLSGKQVSYSFNVGQFSRNIQAESNIKDNKTMFEMLYLSFTSPSIKQNAVDVMIDKYKTQLPARKQSPEIYFNDEITKLVYSQNPYFMPLEVADLDKIDINKASDFAKKCTNPSDWIFVFTGNLKPKDIRNFTETYIASIPSRNSSTESFNEWAYLDLNIAQDISKTLYKGKEDKSIFYSGRNVKHIWSETENLTASVLSEYMDIVMIQEIREKLGGVYSISANASLSAFPPSKNADGEVGEMSLGIYFGCDPKRVQELNTAVEVELQKIADGDINTETLEKARLALVKSFEQSLQSNLYLSTVMANRLQIFNIPLEIFYKRAELIEQINASDIQNFMKLILNVKPIVVILSPEK